MDSNAVIVNRDAIRRELSRLVDKLGSAETKAERENLCRCAFAVLDALNNTGILRDNEFTEWSVKAVDAHYKAERAE